MNTESIDARAELEALLEGWVMEAWSAPPRKEWDEHAVHFTVTVRAPNGMEITTPYSAGSAHPVRQALEAYDKGGETWRTYRKSLDLGFGPLNRKDLRAAMSYPMSLHAEEVLLACAKAYKPNMVDVVHCLLVDAFGIDVGTTFRDWIDDSGAEFEHPADALDAYNGACRAARFVSHAFGSNWKRASELALEL